MKLNAARKEEDLLTFKACNDTTIHLVKALSNKNGVQFEKNMTSRRYNWVNAMLDALVFVDDDEDDTAVQGSHFDFDELVEEQQAGCTSSKDAAHWLMIHLRRKHSDEFVEAAEKLRMPIKRSKMDAATTVEMWDAAGVGTVLQRIINNPFKNHFGWRFSATELGAHPLKDETLQPKLDTCEHDGNDATFWCEDMDDVVNNCIDRHLHEKDSHKNVARVDVVVGGDHGQGSFRAVTSVSLRDDSRTWCWKN